MSAAAALAKIGPTVTLAEATALGSMYAKYDPLWVKWEQHATPPKHDLGGHYYDRLQISMRSESGQGTLLHQAGDAWPGLRPNYCMRKL